MVLEVDTETELMHLVAVAVLEELHRAVFAIDSKIGWRINHHKGVNGDGTLMQRGSLHLVFLVLELILTGGIVTPVNAKTHAPYILLPKGCQLVLRPIAISNCSKNNVFHIFRILPS